VSWKKNSKSIEAFKRKINNNYSYILMPSGGASLDNATRSAYTLIGNQILLKTARIFLAVAYERKAAT
jgi:hypothetical protein